MEHVNHPLWVFIVFCFSIIYLLIEKFPKTQKASVLYDNAKIALEKISVWTTWLTGLQTASMAAMALLTKDKTCTLTEIQKNNGFFVLLFFGASVILSTWLLSSIPSVQQRLVNSNIPDKANDIYEMPIFSFVPFTLGRFSGLIHTYFLIGMVFYALFIFSLF
ncbi:MAG: hypothetical protein J7539_18770 [Niabella sp.]|nr:hypothetical protein [Niabella sp.]